MASAKQPVIDKLKKDLEKELRQIDRGEFVYNIGKQRKFPKVFTSGAVSLDNTVIIRELYRLAYMQSLTEAIKSIVLSSPKKATIPIYDLAKAYDSLETFMFGGDHEGVYLGLLRKLSLEGFLEETTIPEIITAAEHLYTQGYKVGKKGNKFVLYSPAFEEFLELKSAREEEIRDEFYASAIESLVKKASTEAEKSLLEYIFAPITSAEKSVFSPPVVRTGTLSTLSDFSEQHSVSIVESARLFDRQAVATLKESRKRITFVSTRGRVEASYWYTLVDFLENAMLNFFLEEYGFMFLRPYPHAFIVGPDGYITSKAYLINNRLAEDVIDYFPISFSEVAKLVKAELNDEYLKQLRRELSDYAALKFALGKDHISPTEQKIEPATKAIYSFIHGTNELLEPLWYPIATDSIKTESGTNLLLALSDFKDIAEETINYGQLPGHYRKFFGFGEETFTFDIEGDIVSSVDEIRLSGVPVNLLTDAVSFKLNGTALLERNVDVYEDHLSKMVDASGFPIYSSVAVRIKNRLVLFSLLSRFL